MAGEATEHGRSRPDTVDDDPRGTPPVRGVSAWSPVLRSIVSRKRRGGGNLFSRDRLGPFSSPAGQTRFVPAPLGSAHDRRRGPGTLSGPEALHAPATPRSTPPHVRLLGPGRLPLATGQGEAYARFGLCCVEWGDKGSNPGGVTDWRGGLRALSGSAPACPSPVREKVSLAAGRMRGLTGG